MKKILLIITYIFIFSLGAIASSYSGELKSMEDSLFGYSYKGDTDIARVERIEEHIYGEKRTGNINNRIENIKNDIGFTKQVLNNNNNIQPIPQNEVAKDIKQNQKMPELPQLKEDSSVEYAMVDKLEQEIFNTTYKNENIYTRLNRLEEKVFNKTSNADLNTRVDKLASVVKPKKVKPSYQQNTQFYDDINSYYSASGFEPINDSSMPFQLEALEENILKKSYMQDNNANRLSRLENKLFNRNFPNDNDITRLQRIMVAYDAKKNSYKYENNRKMQNMATFSQIGGILLMILAILL